MNPLTFTLAAYLAYAFSAGLAPAWTFGGVAPDPLLVLMLFVGLNAPRPTTLLTALCLGVLADLRPGPLPGGAVLVGPHALGYLLGGYAVLQLRGLLSTRSVVSLVVMTLLVGALEALASVLVVSLRGLPLLAGDPAPWRATTELLTRARGLLLTAALAAPLGLLLNATRKWWSFTARARHEKVF